MEIHRVVLIKSLGLTHLIGTPTLKPYMHGYFLSLKLYSTARLIANPQSYTEHREKIIADRLAAKAESRIRARKDQPKVNKALAERLRRAEEREAKKKRGDAVEGGKATGVLEDDRFKEIFENPEYEVDEESREFALLNPATVNVGPRHIILLKLTSRTMQGERQLSRRKRTSRTALRLVSASRQTELRMASLDLILTIYDKQRPMPVAMWAIATRARVKSPTTAT